MIPLILMCDPTFVCACARFYLFFSRHGGCRPEALFEGSDDGSPPTAGPLVGGGLLIRGAERRRGGSRKRLTVVLYSPLTVEGRLPDSGKITSWQRAAPTSAKI